MQNLLNALVNGTVEYRDNGVQVAVPANAIMLRAARTLKQFLDVNATNNLLIQQLQARESALLVEIEQFRVQQRELYNQLLIKDKNERLQSLRDAEQQTGNVGSSVPVDSESDRVSEEGSTNTDSGLGTN